MFENLKQAQRVGMTPRERLRLWLMGAMMVCVAAAFVGLRQCSTLPGSRNLPSPVDPSEAQRQQRHVDRERLRREVPDDAAGQSVWHEDALERVLSTLRQGVGDRPEPVEASALARLPREEGLGRLYEVQGRITGITSTEFRSERERLWAVVLQGRDGGQVVAVHLARASEPQQGAPTDAYKPAPAELQVGDLAVARGAYVQRRVGTLGGIALTEPTPALVATAFRRVQEPPADLIADFTEAAFDDVNDATLAGTEHLSDPVIYQVLQWMRAKGHAWIREQLRSGALPVQDWGREAFDQWSTEVSVKNPSTPRPFTQGARGKVWRTSGLVGKVLLEDWDSVRPNPWGVHQFQYLYLWSDFYGNSVVPCLSAFPFETFGVQDWRQLDQRVHVYGVFVKNFTYDTQRARLDGEGAQKLTMPLFLVLDVQPYPMGERASSRPVMWVLLGVVACLALLFVVLMRRERREEAALRAHRLAQGRRALQRATGGAVPDGGAGAGDRPPPA